MCVHRVSGRGHRAALMPHHAIIRSERDCFTNSSRADGDADQPDLLARPVTHSSRMIRAELVLTACQASSGERCAVITIRPAVSNGHARPDRVERVLQVVGARSDVHPGSIAARRPPSVRGASVPVRGPGGTGWCAAVRRHRCRRAQRVRRSPAVGAAPACPRLTQWLAVTGCSKPSSTMVARSTRPSDVGIQRFVGVQVDADAAVGCGLEEELGRLGGPAVAFEVWAATDEVGAGVQRIVEEGSLIGGVRPDNRPAAQRDDLHVDHVGDPSADLGRAPRCCAARVPSWCRHECARLGSRSPP